MLPRHPLPSELAAAAPSVEPVETSRPLLSRQYMRFVTVALSGVLVLCTLYTFYFARDFAIPVAAAVILYLVFAPLSRRLARKGLPPAVTAGLVVVSILVSLFAGLALLSDSAATWLTRAPLILSQVDDKLAAIKRPVQQVKEASQRVEKLTEMGSEGALKEKPNVVVNESGVLAQLFGTMQTVVLQLGVLLVLLYFLIASGDIFKSKLVASVPRLHDKKCAILIWREVEHSVSIYLVTISLINVGLGIAIGLALYAIGLPNALLWGAMAGVLNFIPYLGALVGVIIVTVVAIITFDSLGHAALVPLCYVGFNILESQLITPSVLGKRLSLNPVLVFTSVIFWGWLWGMAGAMMAVPFLIIVKIACDYFEKLRFLAEFLSVESVGRRRRRFMRR
jgi:predicted PurR-regulated permease PerM